MIQISLKCIYKGLVNNMQASVQTMVEHLYGTRLLKTATQSYQLNLYYQHTCQVMPYKYDPRRTAVALSFWSKSTKHLTYRYINPFPIESQTTNGMHHSNISHKSILIYWIDQLTHWGRVTHVCVSDLTSIGSDNGLSPGRRQAIIRTNAGILLIRPLGRNFSEFLVEIIIFSFKKTRLNVSSAKRRPFCLSLSELKCCFIIP